MKMYVHTNTKTCTWMWSTASFITAKCWNNKCPSRGEERTCSPSLQWTITQHWKGRIPTPHGQMPKMLCKREEATHRALCKTPRNEIPANGNSAHSSDRKSSSVIACERDEDSWWRLIRETYRQWKCSLSWLWGQLPSYIHLSKLKALA